MENRPHVLIALSPSIRERYLAAADLDRLGQFASWDVLEVEGDAPRLRDALAGADALVVCQGAPRVDAAMLAAAPRIRFIGELENDRFAERIDLAAAADRHVKVVDTTQGSSYPVSEWALAMMLISLRNAGAFYRRLVANELVRQTREDFSYLHGELTGKRVGLIGCGHIGRRLLELLRPFRVDVRVHDPYIPKEIADIYDFTWTSLDYVLSSCDIVVCLAPLTPGTRGMLGSRELGLLPSGTAFVNVSRGAIVDSTALVERLRRGDITAGLDVFDPEPIPVDHPIRELPNAFLSPHIAGVTAASRPRFFALMVGELDRFFHGHATRYDLDTGTMANRQATSREAR